jgi:hypothetical protein
MERLEQIEKEIDELEDFLSENDDKFMKETSDVYGYMEKREPYTKKINKLDRERRLIMPAVISGDVKAGNDMSLEHFIECCNSGGFIDYDGFGRYVKDGKEYDIDIYPSDVKHNSIRKDFDRIVWFNR